MEPIQTLTLFIPKMCTSLNMHVHTSHNITYYSSALIFLRFLCKSVSIYSLLNYLPTKTKSNQKSKKLICHKSTEYASNKNKNSAPIKLR